MGKTVDKKVVLFIVEEYGYRRWLARLTAAEHADLVRRWQTMRNLTCLVPVRLIVPQAEEVEGNVAPPADCLFCHIHEADDSWLAGVDGHDIPVSEDYGYDFFIDGRRYTADELAAFDAPGAAG